MLPDPTPGLFVALGRVGDVTGARDAAQRALTINPDYPAAAALFRALDGAR